MPKRRKANIVLDANWYISACINRNSRAILYHRILNNNQLQVFYSAELLAEFEGVIHRRKFAKKIQPNQLIRFTSLALAFMHETIVQSIPEISRDKNDNYLLGISESCRADFLITGDLDLLILGTHQETTILSMSQFLQMLPFIE